LARGECKLRYLVGSGNLCSGAQGGRIGKLLGEKRETWGPFKEREGECSHYFFCPKGGRGPPNPRTREEGETSCELGGKKEKLVHW